jgi:hypothetical protein
VLEALVFSHPFLERVFSTPVAAVVEAIARLLRVLVEAVLVAWAERGIVFQRPRAAMLRRVVAAVVAAAARLTQTAATVPMV